MNKIYHIYIKDMTCVNCENKLQKGLSHVEGVVEVKVSYQNSLIQLVTSNISIKTIEEKIDEIGYTIKYIKSMDETPSKDKKIQSQRMIVEPKGSNSSDVIYKCNEKSYEIRTSTSDYKSKATNGMKILSTAIIILGGYLILKQLGILELFQYVPMIQQDMGYAMLFFIGLLTSIHCIGMCGGINITQNVMAENKHLVLNNFSYNLGRVISYTIIGGIVGGIGSVFSLGGRYQGMVAIVAGIFMIIMGCNMMNIFPWLRRFNISMPKVFSKKIGSYKSNNRSSFYIGLLNGLMPCGPLQSMQLYALSTGSVWIGAVSMFAFSVGTVPLMFLFGTVVATLNKKLRHTISNVSAVLVVFLGFSMLGNGIGLSGFVVPSISNITSKLFHNESNIQLSGMMEDNKQMIYSELDYGTYPALILLSDVPVIWTIHATQEKLNGCNNEIIINEFGIKHKLVVGDNLITFTPTKEGIYGYSCWMGMIRSTIKVVNQ